MSFILSSGELQEQMEIVSQDEVMDLEMDELNQHECMASMTALLNHMQRNSITPKIEQVCYQCHYPMSGSNIGVTSNTAAYCFFFVEN